jgi:hypothetical protein
MTDSDIWSDYSEEDNQIFLQPPQMVRQAAYCPDGDISARINFQRLVRRVILRIRARRLFSDLTPRNRRQISNCENLIIKFL